MEIKTELNEGDDIYYLFNTKIIKSKVEGISIFYGKKVDKNEISYSSGGETYSILITYHTGHIDISEQHCSSTEEGLKQKIFNKENLLDFTKSAKLKIQESKSNP